MSVKKPSLILTTIAGLASAIIGCTPINSGIDNQKLKDDIVVLKETPPIPQNPAEKQILNEIVILQNEVSKWKENWLPILTTGDPKGEVHRGRIISMIVETGGLTDFRTKIRHIKTDLKKTFGNEIPNQAINTLDDIGNWAATTQKYLENQYKIYNKR